MKLKGKLVSYTLGTLALAAAVLIYMGVKHKLAEPAGMACEHSTKCRGNNIFVSGMCFEDGNKSYCTHECSTADDCTTGMQCQAVDGTWTTESGGGNHATQIRTSQGTRNVCVKE